MVELPLFIDGADFGLVETELHRTHDEARTSSLRASVDISRRVVSISDADAGCGSTSRRVSIHGSHMVRPSGRVPRAVARERLGTTRPAINWRRGRDDPWPPGRQVSLHGFPWPDAVSRARLAVSCRSAHGSLMLRAHAQHRWREPDGVPGYDSVNSTADHARLRGRRNRRRRRRHTGFEKRRVECTVQLGRPNFVVHSARQGDEHDDAGRVHRQVARVGTEGALGGAGALYRPVPVAWRADAGGGGPDRRTVLLRARREEGRRRRRLGRTFGSGTCFAWEYKGKHADLDTAFSQLRQYALALENPPLLFVSDMARFRIRTNWTNSVSATHEFTLDDLTDAAHRDKLKWAMSDPERLRPGESRQGAHRAGSGNLRGTRAVAARSRPRPAGRGAFREPAGVLHVRRGRGSAAGTTCSRGCSNTRVVGRRSSRTWRATCSARCPPAGGSGSRRVAWFNGGLFDDDSALPLDRDGIDTALKAAALDWSEIDPSILGTLFERGLDPDKRSQLGAHYTDRDKIMRIIEPVIVRPLLAEWESEKATIAAALERAEEARSEAARTRRRRQAVGLLRAFLERLRRFTALDPACGSGNFLYLALHALKDIEHRVQLEAEAMGASACVSLRRAGECPGHRDQRVRGGTRARVRVGSVRFSG